MKTMSKLSNLVAGTTNKKQRSRESTALLFALRRGICEGISAVAAENLQNGNRHQNAFRRIAVFTFSLRCITI